MIGSGSQLTIWIWIGIIIFGSVPVSGKIIGPATLLKRLSFYLEIFFSFKVHWTGHTVDHDMCLTHCAPQGRFMLRTGGHTIAAGMVTSISWPPTTPETSVGKSVHWKTRRHQRHLTGKVCTEKRAKSVLGQKISQMNFPLKWIFVNFSKWLVKLWWCCSRYLLYIFYKSNTDNFSWGSCLTHVLSSPSVLTQCCIQLLLLLISPSLCIPLQFPHL